MKVAFCTDEHHPFHDPGALELAYKIVEDFMPDLLIVGSDGMDFYSISAFDKNPARLKVSLQNEIESWQESQRAWIDAAPGANALFLKGNHEDRLRRYLWKNPGLYGLEALELPNLLGLDTLGIIYEKGEDANNEIVIEDKLVIRHGELIRKFSAMTAKAEIESDFHALSTLTGHSHRGGSYYVTTRKGLIQAQEGFCLCRLDPEYLAHPNWQQGIVLVEVGETVSFEPVPFVTFRDRKVARFRGKEYLCHLSTR